jgi:hypothetical protein
VVIPIALTRTLLQGTLWCKRKEAYMQRIHLPNEDEHGWTYDPSSPEQVIEAKLRRQEHIEKRLREMVKAGGVTGSIREGRLGLNQAQLEAICHEARRCFFDGAKLSEPLRQERQRFRERFVERVEHFRTNPENDLSRLAKAHGVLFAIACEEAIRRATGEFADMLTQAIIARRGRKDFPLGFRIEIWKECLRFAMSLAHWGSASFWVDLAWGHDPYESALPHLYKLESIQEQQAAAMAFSDKFRPELEERMRHGSPQWLDEAERRINLRCLFSYVPTRRTRLDDPSKRVVAFLLTASPELSTERMCAKLEKKNETSPGSAPIPEAWRRRGVRSWIDAYDEFPASVKSYVSKVRNQYGIPSGSARRKLPQLPGIQP